MSNREKNIEKAIAKDEKWKQEIVDNLHDEKEEAISDSLKYKEYVERVKAFMKGEIREPKFVPASTTRLCKKGYFRKTFIIRPIYDDLILTYAVDNYLETTELVERIFESFFKSLPQKALKPLDERVYGTFTKKRKSKNKEKEKN